MNFSTERKSTWSLNAIVALSLLALGLNFEYQTKFFSQKRYPEYLDDARSWKRFLTHDNCDLPQNFDPLGPKRLNCEQLPDHVLDRKTLSLQGIEIYDGQNVNLHFFANWQQALPDLAVGLQEGKVYPIKIYLLEGDNMAQSTMEPKAWETLPQMIQKTLQEARHRSNFDNTRGMCVAYENHNYIFVLIPNHPLANKPMIYDFDINYTTQGYIVGPRPFRYADQMPYWILKHELAHAQVPNSAEIDTDLLALKALWRSQTVGIPYFFETPFGNTDK